MLKTWGRPFALVGSVAAYARGIAVRLRHDTDVALLREEAGLVTEALWSAAYGSSIRPRTGS
ncbi:hypothetical protein ACFV2S_05865 [Streptomyces sp. NPDC059695]|uniref:hypothetical protein n=1 Tax=Streptomyces sp. NPDC059695 TaxID=3346910 RepID=UPI0036D0EAD7